MNRYQKRRMMDSGIINLSQVTLTKLTDITPESFLAVTDKKKQAKIKILNERNAVNRFMLEFAELEKSRSLMRTAVNVWYLLNMMSRMKMR